MRKVTTLGLDADVGMFAGHIFLLGFLRSLAFRIVSLDSDCEERLASAARAELDAKW